MMLSDRYAAREPTTRPRKDGQGVALALGDHVRYAAVSA